MYFGEANLERVMIDIVGIFRGRYGSSPVVQSMSPSREVPAAVEGLPSGGLCMTSDVAGVFSGSSS